MLEILFGFHSPADLSDEMIQVSGAHLLAIDGVCRMFLSNQSNRQATEPHDKCPWYGHDVVQYGQRHGKQAQPEVRICMEKRLGYELCQNKDDNRCDARLHSQG